MVAGNVAGFVMWKHLPAHKAAVGAGEGLDADVPPVLVAICEVVVETRICVPIHTIIFVVGV